MKKIFFSFTMILLSFVPLASTQADPIVNLDEAIPAQMVSGSQSSNVIVFDTATQNSVMTMGVAQDPVPLDANLFLPGTYVVITSTDRDACNALTLDQCRQTSGFENESVFQINQANQPTAPDPEPSVAP